MAKHTLSLEFTDTLNDCILLIKDTSIYADKVPVECPYLDILPPGYSCSIRLTMTQGFDVSLTACDLELQTKNCNIEFNPLPDGIYSIKYSVAPNDYVYVEYNYLRVTELMNKFNSVLCSIDGGNCEPDFKTKEKLKELRFIEMLIKAAKAKVEYCHKPGEGMDLYEYAKRKLDKLDCSTCKI